MLKLPKMRVSYVVVGIVFLLTANYQFFKNSLESTFAVESTDQTVTQILFENGIEVTSVPAVYNVKDTESINVALDTQMKEKVQVYDQILYYKKEKLLILYRPSTKTVVSATSLSQ